MPFVDANSLEAHEPRPGWSGRFFHSDHMTFAYYGIAPGADVHAGRRNPAALSGARRGYSPSPAAASASRRFSYTRPSTSLPSRRRQTHPAGASMTRPTPQA